MAECTKGNHYWLHGWEKRIRDVGLDLCQCGWYVRSLRYVDDPAEPVSAASSIPGEDA